MGCALHDSLGAGEGGVGVETVNEGKISVAGEGGTEVAQAKDAAMAELRGQVAGIATAAAEAVVQRQLDASATQLIDQYLSRTGSQN